MSDNTAQTLAPWIAEQLRVLVPSNGHAWLLQGPSGLGQYSLSLETAKAWLCTSPSESGACGLCSSCHLVEVRAHPDLCVLMPEEQMMELDWPISEKAQKEIDDKVRKASKEIRVEAVREMVEFTQRTSSGVSPKVVLIYPAEKLNLYAANTLLKTLEEPAGDTRFIVSSEAAHLLLPTIRSRCQTHTMLWPQAEIGVEWLVSMGLERSEAATLLKASGGRPEDALLMNALGADAALWNKIPRALALGDGSVMSNFTPAQCIAIMQKLCNDLIAHYFKSETRYFDAALLPSSKNLNTLTLWFKELSDAALTSEHPFNAGLMLENLMIQAARAIQN